MWLSGLLLASSLLVPSSRLGLFAQDSAPAPQQTPAPEEEPVLEFFSGTVVAFDQGKLTVSRSVLGRPAEQHDFVLNADTKVEGKLKEKARVTVGFKTSETGDIAVRVIVRQSKK